MRQIVGKIVPSKSPLKMWIELVYGVRVKLHAVDKQYARPSMVLIGLFYNAFQRDQHLDPCS